MMKVYGNLTDQLHVRLLVAVPGFTTAVGDRSGGFVDDRRLDSAGRTRGAVRPALCACAGVAAVGAASAPRRAQLGVETFTHGRVGSWAREEGKVDGR